MPASRTSPARTENWAASSSGRPKSFTRSAPDTLKRSVMTAFMRAFISICRRAIACTTRPTRRDTSRYTGTSASANNVMRQSRYSIVTSVKATPMVLDTVVLSVDVTACCAPTTSLFMRLIKAPVCVRVKKAMGIRWTWS